MALCCLEQVLNLIAIGAADLDDYAAVEQEMKLAIHVQAYVRYVAMVDLCSSWNRAGSNMVSSCCSAIRLTWILLNA